jgi:hypothetical protein
VPRIGNIARTMSSCQRRSMNGPPAPVPFGTRRNPRANASTRLHPGAGRPDRSSGSAVTAAFGPGRLIRPGRALWGLQGAIRHW